VVDLFHVAQVKQTGAADGESDGVAKQGLPFANAAEEVEGGVERSVPRRSVYAAVGPFAVRDDLQVVEGIGVRRDELR